MVYTHLIGLGAISVMFLDDLDVFEVDEPSEDFFFGIPFKLELLFILSKAIGCFRRTIEESDRNYQCKYD